MIVLLYRTLPPEQSLPHDQRWRCIELDHHLVEGLSLGSDTFEASVIKRINEGRVMHVDPIPFGMDVHIVDTDELDSWTLKLKVEKA